MFRSKFAYFPAFLWAATAGQIGLKGQSLGSRKDPSFLNWETDVFTVFRSKFPHFPAFLWAATVGKIGLKRQSLGNQKDPSIQNRKLRFSACSEASSLIF